MKKEITNNDIIAAIEKIDHKVDQVKGELKSDIIAATKKTDDKVDQVRGELKQDITDIKASLASSTDTLKLDITDIKKGFTDLAQTAINSFTHIERRLEKVETNTTWMRNILEQNTGTLLRLDQERLFTINHVNRLENEIKQIKAQLKIS